MLSVQTIRSIYRLVQHHSKRCIEFEESRKRDEQKDKLLIENNWKVLRIKWKDLYKNTKEIIKVVKDCIDK